MNNFEKEIGNPDATTYDECLKIFEFAEMKSKDIFYDLGCGFATVCIAAAENYNLKKNIGIEARIENYLEATNRIFEKKMEKNIILKKEFIENVDFSDATIIYYSVKPNFVQIIHLIKMMQKECKIITPKIPLPSIKPKKQAKINNSDFFLSEGPLEESKAVNAEEWLKFLPKNKNELNKKWIYDLLSKIYSNK